MKIKEFPYRIFLASVLCLITFILIGFFLVFHYSLILKNKTALEHKYKFNNVNILTKFKRSKLI